MEAFIVSSPYQVLNSLQMHYPFEEEADIFVLNQFADCSILVNNLRESKTFKRIIQVENMTTESRRRVKEFVDRNFLYSFRVSGIVGDCLYDQVYFAALDMTVYMLMKYMKKCNPGLKICRMEDGAGDYISDSFIFSSVTDTCFHKVFGGNVFLAGPEAELIRENTYLYEPELVDDIGRHKYIKKLQNNFVNKNFLKKVNEIFEVQKEDIPRTKVLFFDAAANCPIENMDKNLKEVVQLLNSVFGQEKVGIKQHPRRKENIYDSNIIWGCGNVPAEVYFANMQDSLSQRIVVGPFSTANFTPKTIFNAEPYIISLHRILYEQKCFFTEENLSKCEKAIKRLDNLYHTKEKIYVPENMAQFKKIIQCLAI